MKNFLFIKCFFAAKKRKIDRFLCKKGQIVRFYRKNLIIFPVYSIDHWRDPEPIEIRVAKQLQRGLDIGRRIEP